MAKVPAVVQMALGVGNDANAAALAAFRRLYSPLRAIHNRVVKRAGISQISNKRDGREFRLKVYSPASDSPAELGSRACAMMVKGYGRLYTDEAFRMARGLPVGASALDVVDDQTVALLMPSGDIRGVDPIVTPGVILAVIGFLTVVAPIVLPSLMAAAGDVVDEVTGKNKKDAARAAKDAPKSGPSKKDEAREQRVESSGLLPLAAVVAVGGYLATR